MTCLWFLSLLAYGLTILEGVNCWTYNYSDTNMTYDEAEKWCKKFHTNLVAIQNKSENDYLNEILPFNPGYYWIGIRKINDNWTWVGTNESLRNDDQNWATDEPNGTGKNEDCVEIYIKRGTDDGKWNDENCEKRKVALCYRASCNESTCSGNGKCNEIINNYTCDCNPGFYGRNCELAVTCPALTPIAHGSVNCSDPSVNVTWGTNCTFTCEEGFVLTKPATLQCGSSGDWIGEQPSCEAVTCPALTPIAHGSVNCSDPSVNVTWGTNCTFTCEKGFVLTKPAMLQCGSSGDWIGEQPSCEAVTCPALTPIAHGSVNCSDPSVNVTWGTNCMFTCEKGFVLKGPATLHCGSSGKWTEEQPSCEVVQCESLTRPEKGSMVCSPDTRNFTYNTFCHFTCSEGWKLSVLKCNSSGNWSASPPTCEASGQAKQVNYVTVGITATSASVLTAASFFLWLARRLRKKAKKFTPSSSCQSLTIEGSFQHAGKMV
ncbi:E-selectin-like [Cygnus olor]|uniref:E-selectin-like n=1 Tax=Cygnus olor TaxID=8869 RepID=UPI001ADE3311|nr:E-selectin-like [Cygnus olor]XP_040422088.1 E-selectin-like [Cygnus olor]